MPVVAVSRISGQFFVFVAEPGDGGLVAQQRPVAVGRMTGNDYLVPGGLKAGDKRHRRRHPEDRRRRAGRRQRRRRRQPEAADGGRGE